MATRRSSSTQYGPAAKKAVASAIHREKRGTLKSGAGRHPKVKSRKQAIAIGLSEARKQGAKVPPPRAGSKRNAAGSKRNAAGSKRNAAGSKRATAAPRERSPSKRPARKQAASKRTTRKPAARKAH